MELLIILGSVWAYIALLQFLVMVANDSTVLSSVVASAFWFITLPMVAIERVFYPGGFLQR